MKIYIIVSLLFSVLPEVNCIPAQKQTRSLFGILAANKTDDCEHTTSTQEWNDAGYDQDLFNFLSQGPSPNYPWKNGGAPDQSVQKTILSYANKLNNFQCSPANPGGPQCSAQNLGSSDFCATEKPGNNGENNPSAIYIMKTVANYANFMFSMGQALTNASSQVSNMEQQLSSTYNPKQPGSINLAAAAGPLGIASGLVGAIPAFGAPVGVGALLSATMSVATGANTIAGQSQPLEPQFQIYQGFESYVNNVTQGISSVIAQAANTSLNGVPGSNLQDWLKNDPSALTNVLQDGHFADPSSPALTADQVSKVTNLIVVAAINWLMQQQKVFVMRVNGGKNSLPSLGSGDLCAPPSKTVPFDPHVKWCGADGYMYILQRWNYEDTSVPGFTDLQNHDVQISTMFQASWDWQSKHGMGHQPSMDDVKAVVSNVDWNKVDFHALQQWTLPVCNLEEVPNDNLSPGNHGCHGTDPQCWWNQNMFCRCAGMKGWPYGGVGIPNTDCSLPNSMGGAGAV